MENERRLKGLAKSSGQRLLNNFRSKGERTGGGLVEEEDRWVGDHLHADAHPLPLSARDAALLHVADPCPLAVLQAQLTGGRAMMMSTLTQRWRERERERPDERTSLMSESIFSVLSFSRTGSLSCAANQSVSRGVSVGYSTSSCAQEYVDQSLTRQ
jgi:hypothetical protein